MNSESVRLLATTVGVNGINDFLAGKHGKILSVGFFCLAQQRVAINDTQR